jgi:uncharacterized protein YbjT (DUF2867 family)
MTVILVIGGRSKIGTALIEELLARGERVRALARSGEAGFPDGVEPITADLADPSSLNAAMEGAEKVFLLCGPNPDEVALNQNAIDCAQGSDVSLLVRSSIFGARTDSASTFHRDHGICDDSLRDSDLTYTILRPHMFMQNIPENTIPSIGPDGVFYANAGNARISMVDTRDVGAVAAAVLTEPGHENAEYDVTGPEALSYHDVADKLSRAMGRGISYVDAPDEAVRQALGQYGMGDWMVGALIELMQDYRASGADGYASSVSDTVQRLTGGSPRTLDQLLGQSAG